VFHHVFQLCDFLKRDRRSGLTLYATNALTLFKVTTKLLRDDVRREQNITHLENGRKGVSHNLKIDAK
jgi:hypothetical protein